METAMKGDYDIIEIKKNNINLIKYMKRPKGEL